MSIISATRRGFLYQDRAAIQIYLDAFLNRNIDQFFIDFPLAGSRKSIDIRHIDKNKMEHIFEIKSGEEFKKNKSKKDSTEFREAIITLKAYSDTCSVTRLTLVIRKGFKHKIAEYWQHLSDVLEKRNFHAINNHSLEWLYEKLYLPGISSLEALLSFLSNFRLIDFEDDARIADDDLLPAIDDFNVSMIKDISIKFKANAHCNIYPPEILMHELYHLCRIYAGSSDIHPFLLRAITNFISHKRFIDESYKQEIVGLERKKEKIFEDVDKEISKFLGLIPSDKVAQIINTQEGKTI